MFKTYLEKMGHQVFSDKRHRHFVAFRIRKGFFHDCPFRSRTVKELVGKHFKMKFDDVFAHLANGGKGGKVCFLFHVLCI